MKSSHAVVLSLLLAVAAVAATLAVLKTTSLGMRAKPAAAAGSAEQVAARNAQLDRTEAALRRALRKKPPALPKLPVRQTPAAHPASVSSSPASSQGAVIVATPAPEPSSSEDDGHESEHEEGETEAGDD
jgi:hypothetical protein